MSRQLSLRPNLPPKWLDQTAPSCRWEVSFDSRAEKMSKRRTFVTLWPLLCFTSDQQSLESGHVQNTRRCPQPFVPVGGSLLTQFWVWTNSIYLNCSRFFTVQKKSWVIWCKSVTESNKPIGTTTNGTAWIWARTASSLKPHSNPAITRKCSSTFCR